MTPKRKLRATPKTPRPRRHHYPALHVQRAEPRAKCRWVAIKDPKTGMAVVACPECRVITLESVGRWEVHDEDG